MITFPLYIFIFLFFFFLLLLTFFTFVNIYHLVHMGNVTVVSAIITLLFLAYTILIIWFTLQQLAPINWQTPIVINFANWFGGNPNFGI